MRTATFKLGAMAAMALLVFVCGTTLAGDAGSRVWVTTPLAGDPGWQGSFGPA